MKIHVINVSRSQGISNKSGSLKNYDICQLSILQPLQPFEQSDSVAGTRYHKMGAGFEAAEIAFEPSLFEEFLKVKYPAYLDLELTPLMQFGKVQTVCTGFGQVSQPQQKAA